MNPREPCVSVSVVTKYLTKFLCNFLYRVLYTIEFSKHQPECIKSLVRARDRDKYILAVKAGQKRTGVIWFIKFSIIELVFDTVSTLSAGLIGFEDGRGNGHD
ncbi:hypothetical protein QYF36_001169 [Acer negundo]|nr:hypothetical protein QYF36_001169 [Acer negundo]